MIEAPLSTQYSDVTRCCQNIDDSDELSIIIIERFRCLKLINEQLKLITR